MKKVKTIVFNLMLISSVGLGLSSCGGEDESQPADNAINVAADYSGYALMSSAYFNNRVSLDQTLKLIAVDRNVVKVSYTSSDLGSFVIAAANVAEQSGKYSVSGTGVTTMGMGDNSKDYECALKALVNRVDRTSSFEFVVPAVMGGTTVTFYEGELPESLYKNVVAAAYSGHSIAKSQYFPQGMSADDQTIVVTANADNSVKVQYQSDMWGQLTVEAATIVRNGNKFNITGSGKALMGMDGQQTKSYDCTFNGSVDADASQSASFSFVLPSVMGGLTITFNEGALPQ